jgi:hypothetical protein
MRERKSCISIEPAKEGCLYHITREIAPNYLIDSSSRNSYDRTVNEAEDFLFKLRSEAISNYTSRTKQKIQVSPAKELWEAVIVLEKRHTLLDVKKVANFLEKKYGWRYILLGLHLDEGYYDEEVGKKVFNYHAHIVFFMLSESGIYIFKKRDFQKKEMSIIQTEVANILQMKRGVSKRKTGREHISAKAYRRVAKELDDLRFELKRISGESNDMLEALLVEQAARIEYEKEVVSLKEIVSNRDSQIKELTEQLKTIKDENIVSQKVNDDSLSFNVRM